jgi:chromosome segregation ATPase
MLIGFACLAIAGWYSQNQRVQALEGQLEEADYWARQSKLALARFEGDLSETGESLQQRGASLAEQMAANKKLLDTANSEIRKLWVVANERNKERLNKHQERLTAVEKDLAEEKQALVALSTSVENLRSSFSADLAALQEQTQTSVSALQDADRQAADQLMGLSKKVGDVESLIDGKIRRFEQEQKLGIKGMESRITALEKAAGGDSQFQALQEELNRLKSTVQAIDSSRAQLTSRLVRLSDEVNALRSKQ